MNKLIIFTAAWCGPCKALKATVSTLSEEYSSHIELVDIDEDKDLRDLFEVRAVPTIVSIAPSGEEKERKVGAQNKTSLESMILG